MKLILTSIDSDLFDEKSYVRARMVEYAKACERLEVVCVTRRKDAHDVRLSANANLIAVSVPRLLAPFVLFSKITSLVNMLGREETLISSQDPFFLGLVCLAAARRSGVPLHTQVHISFFTPWYRKESLKHLLLSRLAGFVLTRSDRIRTVSQKITDYCRTAYRIPESRIDTIPLLIDLKKIRAGEGKPVPRDSDLRALYPQFSRIVLMACRLTAQKNIPLALRAFKRVLEIQPKAGLVIVGRGEEEQKIRNMIRELDMTESVVLIPWSNDVPSLMRSADVFLMSSDYEGYGMTVVEASATGLPVVMTDVGCAGDFLMEGENGLVVAIGDESALAAALLRVLEDDALRARLSTGGKRAAGALPTADEYNTRIAASWKNTLSKDISQCSEHPRVLFITQTVDRADLPLSFTHDWIESFSKSFGKMIVLTLNRGDHDLPGVEVFSLGKESGKGRPTYIYRLFKYAWTKRKEYDAVFIHQNQEYALLAGWLWRLLGKRVYMWRNHYAGSWKTDLASFFCTKVFCTSRYSYTAKYKKTVFMPVGVDTSRFFPSDRIARAPRSILFFSRMTPAKRPDLFIEALGLLLAKGISFTASVYGSPYPADVAYYESLKARAEALGLHNRLQFHPGVANAKAPDIFRAYELFVNCSADGMFDKTIFEAAACGCLVLASSLDFAHLAGEELSFKEGDSEKLMERLAHYLESTEDDVASANRTLSRIAESNSLDALAARLTKEIS